ncbi:MAG TPA: lipoyl synthase, partial [Pelovirga sp.]|nr:lipoyl synthase [Pelovirga sp.]
LYSQVRPEADYRRSLAVLTQVQTLAPTVITKSGLMLGMGEEYAEVIAALGDLRDHGCRIVTLGQYLAPTKEHYPLKRYVTPEEFADLAAYGKRLGFDHVEAGPLVRSSYHAEEQFAAGKASAHG